MNAQVKGGLFEKTKAGLKKLTKNMTSGKGFDIFDSPPNSL